MADQKECFIIMPITTPKSMIEKYRDGEEHFKHVLDCLFIPAVKKAGYNPKPPVAKGADLIHAEIISNLESSDIVLCDMSCLNPNVFFEFGIRTSINKAVCVVKDELTKSVPFDTGILNHQVYRSSLDPWHLDAEIKKLSDHITASAERSKGQNMLWKYFGLKAEAVPYKGESGTESMLDYISLQLESLQDKVEEIDRRSEAPEKRFSWQPNLSNTSKLDMIYDHIRNVLPKSISLITMTVTPNGVEVDYSGNLTERDQKHVINFIKNFYDKDVIFRNIDASST